MATALVLAGTVLAGCPNSILRNAAEAAFEGAAETPVPTLTAVP